MRDARRVALITGAAGGIGAAVSRRLAQEGFDLRLMDADAEGLKRLETALDEHAVEVSLTVVDLTDASAVELATRTVLEQGPVDVLVNNAGVAVAADLPSTGRSDWHRIFAVNVHAIYEICRLVVPAMVDAGGGCVVNIASVAAAVGIKDRAAYCATKGAVVSLSRAMAVDHAADNVRVNAICPGTVHTGWIDSILAGRPDVQEARAAMEKRQLVGRLGHPDEIADAVMFIVGNDFTTGSALVVDGGMTTV